MRVLRVLDLSPFRGAGEKDRRRALSNANCCEQGGSGTGYHKTVLRLRTVEVVVSA